MILAAALFLVALPLLWVVTAARGPWQIKLALILAAPLLALQVYRALNTFSGYPHNGKPPKAQLLAGYAVEPDKQTGAPGAIYLWLIPPREGRAPWELGYKPSGSEPRAYRLPYRRSTHESLEKARQALQRGARVGTNAGAEVDESLVRFYKLPPAGARRK